ncbi:MAG: heavy-metal-associated domain-containing protein [Rickettsiales bacterium]|nr:heavy-metal-associated domain-containing protein [Rickettsiales bacterium]
MFRKFITVFSLIFLINISSAFAKEINIDVNGLVCEFCGVTIEKNFKKKDEIKEVKVDLDQKKVFLTFKDGKNLSDKAIEDTIANNGYNVVKINR